jgi:hypothetical protein
LDILIREKRIHSINRTGDKTMITNTRIAIAAALVLGSASAALANDSKPNPSAISCPTLEGYPDCHPDGRASWTPYSTTGEDMAQKMSPTKFNGMRHER